MRCCFGHDHSMEPVVRSVQNRPTLGDKALDQFHCEQHQMKKVVGNWRTPMRLRDAEILELVPCKTCFPEVWAEFRKSRAST